MATCSVCGEESSPRARFCWSCGNPLGDAEEPAREVRKTVTVVFCDLAGSTALAAERDPEALRRVLTRYFDEMRGVLEQHGGTVEKFIGDAVMAVFGTPVVREDDAIRAVRAALEMRERVPALNEAFQREWGMSIAVRLGVNTGEVVAGDAAARQTFVTGEAVNVAQRLESAAGPSQILIGADTHRLVRDLVEAEAVAPLMVRGKDRPVEAYRLLGLRASPARRESPMVGRSHELAALVEAFASVLEARECQLVSVVGDAGVGKSRLLSELVRSVEGEALALTGRCLPYGEGITYWPLVEVLRRAAGPAEDGGAEQAGARLAELAGEDAARPLLGVLGLAPAAAVEETSWAVRALVEALARRQPLLLAFDDVQWAEPTLLDLLEHLRDRVADAPVLLVCLTRPELLERRPAFADRAIPLDPLEDDDSLRLLGNLLGGGELDRDLRARILEAAGGNPLFVEEMLSMLLEEGLVVERGGVWAARDDGAGVPVPATIQALLVSRLDQLRDSERLVVERAAVVGKEFERRSLAALLPQLDEPGLRAALEALERKELIVPLREAEAYAFRHILIRDAAYEALPKHLRARLHEQLAAWIERSARGPELEEIEAYHLEQSFRYRGQLGPVDEQAEALGRRAALRLASAGRRALERGDTHAASTLLRRAVELPASSPQERVAALVGLARGYRELALLGEARDTVDAALAAAHEACDERLEAHASMEAQFLTLFEGADLDVDHMARTAAAAEATFERCDDELGLTRALGVAAYVHFARSRIGDMEEVLDRALLHAARAGVRRELLLLLGARARASLVGPTPVVQAVRRCRDVLEAADGDRTTEAVVYIVLACLDAMRGRFDETRSLVERSKGVFRDHGRNHPLAAVHAYAATVEELMGEPAGAERELRTAHALFSEAGDRTQAAAADALLARLLAEQGRVEEAELHARVSERHSPPHDVESQVVYREALSRARAAAGLSAEARDLAGEALALADATDYLNLRAQVRTTLSRVLAAAGDERGAARARNEAVRLYLAKGNTVAATRARAEAELAAR